MNDSDELKRELEYLRTKLEEFRSLYAIFDNTADTADIEPEDLEVRLRSFSSSGLAYNKTRYYEEVVLLCERLGMLKEVPQGLSDLEAVKVFIKANVRRKKELEQKVK